MKCYVCGDDAVRRPKSKNMCDKHARFKQMQSTAKHDGKYVPSLFELEAVTPKDMICQDCGEEMNWSDGENRSKGAVLQHYRDGTIAITCLSCNTKHGLMHGDTFRELPDGHKLCRSCKTIKPLSEFGRRSKDPNDYPKSSCKECHLEKQRKWREENPDRYKSLNKKHNDIRRQNPELARERDKKYYWAKKERKINGSIALRSNENSTQAGQGGNGPDSQGSS